MFLLDDLYPATSVNSNIFYTYEKRKIVNYLVVPDIF